MRESRSQGFRPLVEGQTLFAVCCVAGAVGIGLRSVRVIPVFVIVILLLLVVATAIVAAFLARKTRPRDFLPLSLTDLMLNSGTCRRAMVDLWMTGAGRQTVVEAVILESKQKEQRQILVALAVLATLPISFYILLRRPAAIPAATLIAAWLFLLTRARSMLESRLGLRGLKRVFRHWQGGIEGPVIRSVRLATYGYMVLVFAGIAGLGVFVAAAFVEVASAVIPPAYRGLPFEYYVSIALFLISGAAWIARRSVIRHNESALATARLQAEDLYDMYMQKLVLQGFFDLKG